MGPIDGKQNLELNEPNSFSLDRQSVATGHLETGFKLDNALAISIVFETGNWQGDFHSLMFHLTRMWLQLVTR